MRQFFRQLDRIAGQPSELFDPHEAGRIVSQAARRAVAAGQSQFARYIDDGLELGIEAARRIVSDMIMPVEPPAGGPLTVAQAAERFNLGKRTLYRLVETGEIDAARVGKAIRIRPADLDRYLNRRPGTGSLFG